MTPEASPVGGEVDVARLREDIARRLEDLNVDGWIVYPHPNTGEPMQERVPLDYIADAVLDAIRPRLEAAEAALGRVEAIAATPGAMFKAMFGSATDPDDVLGAAATAGVVALRAALSEAGERG